MNHNKYIDGLIKQVDIKRDALIKDIHTHSADLVSKLTKTKPECKYCTWFPNNVDTKDFFGTVEYSSFDASKITVNFFFIISLSFKNY